MQAGMAVGNLASAIGIRTEDASLVADLKAGSEEAFGLLIAQYHQPLYSLITRSLNDPADAADITQEVFIKVFRSIRSFNGDASLRTWLYRIALHEASNQRRWWSRHKRQEISIDAPVDRDDRCRRGLFSLASTLADRRRLALRSRRPGRDSAFASKPPSASSPRPSAPSSSSARSKTSPTKRSPRSSTLNLGTVKSRLTRGRAALRALLASDIPSAQIHREIHSRTLECNSHPPVRRIQHGRESTNEPRNDRCLTRSAPRGLPSHTAPFSDYLDGAVSGHTMHAIAAPPRDLHRLHRRVRLLARHAAGALADLALHQGPRRPRPQAPLRHLPTEGAHRDAHWVDKYVLQLGERRPPHAHPGLRRPRRNRRSSIGSIAFLLGIFAAPQAVLANDVPLDAITAPHYLYSAASPRPILDRPRHHHRRRRRRQLPRPGLRLPFVSAPDSPEVQHQVAEQLLLNVFEPARIFGAPVRGRAIITFAGISVQG